MDTQSKVVGLFVSSLTRGLNSETTATTTTTTTTTSSSSSSSTTSTIGAIIIMLARALAHYGLSCQVVFSTIVLGVLL